MLLLLAAVCLSSEATEDASGTPASPNESTVEISAVSADSAAEPPNQTVPEHQNDTATSDIPVIPPTDAETSSLEQAQQVRANETVESPEIGTSSQEAPSVPPTSEAPESDSDAASATFDQATSEAPQSDAPSVEESPSEREDQTVEQPTSEAPEEVVDAASATSEEPATPSPTASPAPTVEVRVPPTVPQVQQKPAPRDDARRPARVDEGKFGVDEEAVKKQDPVVTEEHSPFSALVALVVAVAIGCAIAYGLYVTFATDQRPDDLEERVPFNYSLSSKRERDDMEKLGFNRL